MEKLGATLCCIAIGAAAVTQVSLHVIDRANAQRCNNHAWPKELNQLHRDWCIANQYPL